MKKKLTAMIVAIAMMLTLIPVGAFAMTKRVAEYSLKPGDHGATYGGNPLACTAVKKVLEIFEKERILDHINEVSPYLTKRMDELAAKWDCIVQRKGTGLMQGLQFNIPVSEITKKTVEEGLLLIQAGGNIIRFLPPLILEEKHVDEMVERLERALSSFK